MDGQNARLIATCAAGLAAVAISVRLLSTSLSIAGRQRIAPSVRSSLSLWSKLELRSLQSLTYLLAAFGPNGYNAVGAAPGAMIASPSRPDDRPGGKDENENYFFQWPRDSALCVREVVRQLILAQQGRMIGVDLERSGDLETVVRDFITMSIKLQHLDNPSGSFETGGLGEPKFNVDGSAFTDDWGRPQNDGPALRAITTLVYANYLLQIQSKGATSYVLDKLYNVNRPSLVKDDLDYVARVWKEKTFELWEEVEADSEVGGHFHVLMVQRRALLAGAQFARREEVKDPESAERYEAAAESITERLEDFWNPSGELGKEGGPEYTEGPLAIDWHDARNLGNIPHTLLNKPHVIGTLARIGGQPKPCQVDVAVLLGFTHGWDGDIVGSEEEQQSRWLPWSDRCLATLDRLVDVFAVVYPLNAKRSPAHGVLCGRYPEDVYDGVQQSIGHPWFLCTHAISEVLSIVAHHYAALPSEEIHVTPFNQGFWSKVSHAAADDYHTRQSGNAAPSYLYGIRPGSYGRTSKTYERLLAGLWRMSDGYLSVCDDFVGPADRMSEQIERSSGRMRGARELSWSYASFLSAVHARKGHFVSV